MNKEKFKKSGISEENIQEIVKKCSTLYEDEGLRDRTVDICFKYADVDGDGFITKEECKHSHSTKLISF